MAPPVFRYAARANRASAWSLYNPVASAARTYRVWFWTTVVLAAVVLMCTCFAAYSIGELTRVSASGSGYKTSVSIVMGTGGAATFVASIYRLIDFSHNNFVTMTGLTTLYNTLGDAVANALESVVSSDSLRSIRGTSGDMTGSVVSVETLRAEIKSAFFPILTLQRPNIFIIGTGVVAVALELAAFLTFASSPTTALFLGFVGAGLFTLAAETHMGTHRSGFKEFLRDIEDRRAFFTSDGVASFYVSPAVTTKTINGRYSSAYANLKATPMLIEDAMEAGTELASVTTPVSTPATSSV